MARGQRPKNHFAKLKAARTAGPPIIPGPPKAPLEGQLQRITGINTTATGTESRAQRRKKGTKKTPEEIAALKTPEAIAARKTPEGIAATKKAKNERQAKARNARTARQEKAKARNAAIANEHLKIATQAANTTPTPEKEAHTQKQALSPTQAVGDILHTQRLIPSDAQSALRRTPSEAAAIIQHQKTKAENITKINNAISKLNNFTKRPQQDIASITVTL